MMDDKNRKRYSGMFTNKPRAFSLPPTTMLLRSLAIIGPLEAAKMLQRILEQYLVSLDCIKNSFFGNNYSTVFPAFFV